MSRKLIASCTAIASVVAIILPAAASAANDPQITSGGFLVPSGTSVKLTPVGAIVIWTNTEGSSSLISCNSLTMTGTVTKNTASTVEISVPLGSAVVQGTGAVNADNSLPECTGSFGNSYVTFNTAICVTSNPTMAEDEFQMTGGSCGTGGKIKFTIGSTTAGACQYETTGSVKGNFTTGGAEGSLTTVDTSTGSGSKLIAGGFLCPTSLAWKTIYKVETTNNVPLVWS